MARVKEWSVADMKVRVRRLREQLAFAASDIISEDELAALYPGGAQNTLPSPACWWWTWGTYVSYARAMEVQQRRLTSDVELRGAIARRSARAAEKVTLTSGKVVSVHPKSYWALRFLDFLDREHRLAAALAIESLTDSSPEGVTLHALSPIAEAMSVRIWAWILTHPERGLPFREDATNVDPPEWTARLMADDLILLARAHQRVHIEDLRIIAEAFPQDGKSSALGLEGFLNTFVEAGGYTNFDVFRNFTVGEIYANTVSRAVAAKEARDQADAKKTTPAEL